MTAAGWSRVGPLLDELLGLEGAARSARLAELWAEAPAIAAELEQLLRADASTGGLLDQGLPVPPSTGVTALPDLTGEHAGPYRLTHRLGLGGMGVVYAAQRADGSYRQSVAVKVVPEASSALGRRFLRERAILAALDHPGIARLLDAGTLSSGQPFFVMERVEGATLLEHCDGARASVDSRLRIFLQVCDAVAFAHKRLVVHRDIKPSNIVVQPDGTAKLLDFGVASLLSEEPTESWVSLTRAFTPDYAAPEQLRGQTVGTAADVYALGVLLHELLAGVRPARSLSRPDTTLRRVAVAFAELPGTTAEAVARARAMRAEELRERLCGDLDAIVGGALKFRVEERYASVEHLAADVRRHLEGLAVEARGSERVYRARRFVRRHRVAVASIMVAFLGLAAGLFVSLEQTRAARSEAARAGALRRFLTWSLKRELVQGRRFGPDGPALVPLLARGLPAVDEQFPDQPEAAAEIYSVAGESLRLVGALDDSARALREALRRKSLLYPAADAKVREARFDLAQVLAEQGDEQEARPLLEVLESETRGAVTAERESVTATLGEVLRRAGDLPAAERLARESVAIVTTQGARAEPHATSLNRLAAVLYQEGRYLESAAILAEARSVLPAHELGTEGAQAEQDLREALALHRAGDLRLAEARYRQALASRSASLDRGIDARISCGLAFLAWERGDASLAGAVAPSDRTGPASDPRSGFSDPGVPCSVLSAWENGDTPADLERGLLGVMNGAGSFARRAPAARADGALLLAELRRKESATADCRAPAQLATALRDANPGVLAWRRAEAHLLLGLCLAERGDTDQGRSEIAASLGAVREAVPRHRYLPQAEALLRR